MSNPRVYLAGPIRGLNYGEATAWRETATRVLAAEGIDAFSPMRAKSYLDGLTDVGGDKLKDSYDQFPLSTMKAILCRDRNDCQKAGVVIMYLLEAKSISIGSVMEVAWADAARVPIVLVMEKEGNVHEHGLLTETCNIRVKTLDEAIKATVAILKP